ncbi:MAG: hypothetical protein LBJ74_04640 [Heliobacteriaceae bacterium]|jgi:hypothetical protein|nr:hypothetical protein [Heliobacteriaceae bacterium]
MYYIIAFLVGLGLGLIFYFREKSKLSAYKRELEKTSVAASSGSSKVGVLEAKIQVLEKALQDALSK